MSEEWRQAGAAWGERAVDWAYLFEPSFAPTYRTVLPRLGLGPGTRHLDIACGSGLAAHEAVVTGATVEGIDAAEGLLAIARRRSPEAVFVAGDMYALPYPDASFDTVVSFNGIFGGDDAAMREAARVVRPGGRVAVGFWGRPRLRDHFEVLVAFGAFKEAGEAAAEASLLEIGKPGVAEGMFTAAGLEVEERGISEMVSEWPDVETGVRACAAAGPAWPVLQGPHAADLRAALRAALVPFDAPGQGVRMRSEMGFLIGRRP